MPHPEPPTHPCPGCGEDLPAETAKAYTWLYTTESQLDTKYARIIEAAITAYGARRAEPVARAIALHMTDLEPADLVAAAHHRLNDE